MGSSPSVGLQVALPFAGAFLGAFIFLIIGPFLDQVDGPRFLGATLLVILSALLLPGGLAFLFHPSLYAMGRFGLAKGALVTGFFAVVGAALGLISIGVLKLGILGVMVFPPVFASLGAFFSVSLAE